MSSLINFRNYVLQRRVLPGCARYCTLNQLGSQHRHPSKLQIVRCMSSKRGFLSDFIDNLKSELDRNKPMKESLKKFQEEADKLEQSDSLKKVREKFQSVETETLRHSDAFTKKFSEMQDMVKKSDYAKRGKEIAEDVAESVSKAAETVSKQTEHLAQTQVFKTVSQGVNAVKVEIEESTNNERSNLYKAPEKLRKRDAFSISMGEKKTIEADETTSNVVNPTSSSWHQSWESFKNDNQLFNKLFDMKSKYDTSGNIIIRATRTFTDKVSGMFGGMFTRNEMSEVLTQIDNADKDFDAEKFLKQCRSDIIPNVLEAMIRGDLEVLKDWCHEGAFNVLSIPIKEAKTANYVFDSKVLDINNVDVAGGKMTEQGPVLVINFIAQQIMVVRDVAGKVVEGDPEKIVKVSHVWALCRDQNIFDPMAAWRLIDISCRLM